MRLGRAYWIAGSYQRLRYLRDYVYVLGSADWRGSPICYQETGCAAACEDDSI
jgi:hypothetical protein